MRTVSVFGVRMRVLTGEDVSRSSKKGDLEALRCSLTHWRQIRRFCGVLLMKKKSWWDVDYEVGKAFSMGSNMCACCGRARRRKFVWGNYCALAMGECPLKVAGGVCSRTYREATGVSRITPGKENVVYIDRMVNHIQRAIGRAERRRDRAKPRKRDCRR